MQVKFPGASKSAKALAAAHPRLKALIGEIGKPEMSFHGKRGVFEALTMAITHQQLHGKAAETILKRFVALFPKGRAFPQPAAVLAMPVEKLMTAGLSRSKANAILDLAAKVEGGAVPSRKKTETLSNEEIITALTQVKGIGRWTVEMFLMFTLGREDVFPVHDFGVRAGYAIVFRKKKMPSPKELEKAAARFVPHGTVLAWYLWRAADRAKMEPKRKKATP